MIRYRVRVTFDERVGTVEVRDADGEFLAVESEPIGKIRSRWVFADRQVSDAQATRQWAQVKGRLVASTYAHSRGEAIPKGNEVEVVGP